MSRKNKAATPTTKSKRPVVESFEPKEVVRGTDFVPFVIRGTGFLSHNFPEFIGPCWAQEFEVVSDTEIRGRLAVDGRDSDESVRLVLHARRSFVKTGIDIPVVGETTYDPYTYFKPIW